MPSGQLQCRWVGGLLGDNALHSPFFVYVSLCLHCNKRTCSIDCLHWFLLMKNTISSSPHWFWGLLAGKLLRIYQGTFLYGFGAVGWHSLLQALDSFCDVCLTPRFKLHYSFFFSNPYLERFEKVLRAFVCGIVKHNSISPVHM